MEANTGVEGAGEDNAHPRVVRFLEELFGGTHSSKWLNFKHNKVARPRGERLFII